jgi:hypothetical protein
MDIELPHPTDKLLSCTVPCARPHTTHTNLHWALTLMGSHWPLLLPLGILRPHVLFHQDLRIFLSFLLLPPVLYLIFPLSALGPLPPPF